MAMQPGIGWMARRLVKLETSKGEVWELSMLAVRLLQKAKNGRDAEWAFEQHAPHIPRRARADVWFAVDNV